MPLKKINQNMALYDQDWSASPIKTGIVCYEQRKENLSDRVYFGENLDKWKFKEGFHPGGGT